MKALLCIGNYQPAVAAFCRIAKKITGKAIPASSEDDGVSDLILIGADVDNLTLHAFVESGVLSNPGVRAGSEDCKRPAFR